MESNERVTLVPINTTLAAEPQQPTKRSENNNARPRFIALKAMERKTLISEKENGEDGDWNGKQNYQGLEISIETSASISQKENLRFVDSLWDKTLEIEFAYSDQKTETNNENKNKIHDNDKEENAANY